MADLFLSLEPVMVDTCQVYRKPADGHGRASGDYLHMRPLIQYRSRVGTHRHLDPGFRMERLAVRFESVVESHCSLRNMSVERQGQEDLLGDPLKHKSRRVLKS